MDKVIISDTSCLIALTKIGKLDLLRDLYQEIVISTDVYQEFGSTLPNWILIREHKNKVTQQELEKRLDKGESSAIALAMESDNSILIIDEIKGRKIARSLNVEIIGTIGIILLANKKGLINDVIGTMLQLTNMGFRLSDKLIQMIVEKYDNK